MNKHIILVCISIMTFNLTVKSMIRLPYVFSDNMVIQREIPFRIWGGADQSEKITFKFNGIVKRTKADKFGNWEIMLPPSASGGPFDISIEGNNKIVLKNILVGDVWLCSGQSNMEFPFSESRNAATDICFSNNNQLRLFTVPNRIAQTPQSNTLKTSWAVCDSTSVSGFSAVGYYFGKDIQKKLNVPIGLIAADWGGTDIETWISLNKMYADTNYTQSVEKLRNADFFKSDTNLEEKWDIWNKKVAAFDKESKQDWLNTDTENADWKTMKLPTTWENAGLRDLDGVVWFKKNIELSKKDCGNDIFLTLGRIDDIDSTYFNGTLIGSNHYYSQVRNYKVDKSLLHEGTNTISIRVTDTGGSGGIWGNDGELNLKTFDQNSSLAGEWKYKIGINMEAPASGANPNSYPSLLYNGMIHPLVKFGIKGVIWYQGENNATRYKNYQTLFTRLIEDWREKFNNPELPFLFVQLANYMQPTEDAGANSDWAELRYAQYKTLALPKTGMAVSADIGEANNIHPKNKDEVGRRLALAAIKVAYNIDTLYSGPTFASVQRAGGVRLIIEFKNAGTGLTCKDKYGYVKAFAVAGEDGVFHYAKASVLDKNHILLFSEKVINPVSIRYGWADNPDDINLYNNADLPAVPFKYSMY